MNESISEKVVRFTQEQAIMGFLGYLHRNGYCIAEYRDRLTTIGYWSPVSKSMKEWIEEYRDINS